MAKPKKRPLEKPQFEQVPVGRLTHHPDNPRRGDVEALKDSIKANGFYGALVVQHSTGRILVGNHRFDAAVELGFKTVPVAWAYVNEEGAKKILLVDNRASDLAGYDERKVVELLRGLTDMRGTGYTDHDLEMLTRSLLPIEIPNEFPELNENTVTTKHVCPKCSYRF